MAIQFLIIPIAAAIWSACSDSAPNHDESDAPIDKDPGNTTLDIPNSEVDPHKDAFIDEADAFIEPETRDETDHGPAPDEDGDAPTSDTHFDDIPVSDTPAAADAADANIEPEPLPEPDVTEDVEPLPNDCSLKFGVPSCNVIDMAAGQSATSFVMADGSIRITGLMRPITGDPEAFFHQSTTPQKVEGFADTRQVAMWGHHLLTRDGAGKVWGLGRNNSGQLCNGTSGKGKDSTTPTPTLFPDNMVDVQTGSFHSGGRHSTGYTYTCGASLYGQLGIGKTVPDGSPLPLEVPVPTVVQFFGKPLTSSALEMGPLHTLVIQESGAALGCGLNYLTEDGNKVTASQLGLPEAGSEIFSPSLVEKSILRTAAGEDFTILLSQDCILSAAGNGGLGQLGLGGTESTDTFSVIDSIEDVAEVKAGAYQACAITQSGELYCWGNMELGIDDKGTEDSSDDTVIPQTLLAPKLVTGIGTVWKVTLGENHICAMNTSCDIFCRGANDNGQLGVEGIPYSLEPVKVDF